MGVAYGSDPAQVLEMLVDIATNHGDVLKVPAPLALFLGFGDSSLDFELRFWTSHFDGWLKLRSDVAMELHGALKKAGIEIPFPQRDIHVRSVAPGTERAFEPRTS